MPGSKTGAKLLRSAIRDPRSEFGILLAALLLLWPSGGRCAFEEEDENEEAAGASGGFLANPADKIYGVSVGYGVWIRETPVFGDYFVNLFSNGIEDSWYSGLGMTIRLMPHWRFAPFAGGGASYNYSLSGRSQVEEPSATTATGRETDLRGDSYWGGHAEAGLRIWIPNRIRLLEIMGRYTWSSSRVADPDYWLVGLSLGAGI
jgi:hypothetical protein